MFLLPHLLHKNMQSVLLFCSTWQLKVVTLCMMNFSLLMFHGELLNYSRHLRLHFPWKVIIKQHTLVLFSHLQ